MTIVDTLVKKWSRTGLLKGLTRAEARNMARLLEGQATEILRELTMPAKCIKEFRNGVYRSFGCSVEMCYDIFIGGTCSRDNTTFSSMQVKR